VSQRTARRRVIRIAEADDMRDQTVNVDVRLTADKRAMVSALAADRDLTASTVLAHTVVKAYHARFRKVRATRQGGAR
jgi:hypothetical protein